MKIYLADLVHTWEKASTWTFPLNIGYVGAYAQKVFGDKLDIRLFKRPEKLIDAIKADPPDVLGMSYYVWNANLNGHVANIAKAANPACLVVGGGPNFTAINNDEDHARDFFHRQPSVDAYVVNQGELGFAELIGAFIDRGETVEGLRDAPVAGCTLKGDARAETVLVGDKLDALRELDVVPSPYLNGMLDEFFDEPFAPVLETNRSCPYRCTFCAWGIGTAKLAKFEEERVKAEIDYIGKRCKNAAQLFIADANFGILERDVQIGRWLAESHEKHGFPGHLAVQWHKAKPDRVLRTAREVKDIARLGASMQSMNIDTLGAVKRKNLPLEDVLGMIKTLQDEGADMPLVSELILGLPEETRQSHLDANRRMIDLGAEMINYNLYLLPGTEMDTRESRDAYFRQTGFRLMDNAFGIYDGKKVFEGQETVQATSTMSRDELRGFRFYHFLLQFMWGGRWYYDYLQMLKSVGIHPVDAIDHLTETCRVADGDIGDMVRQFTADHDLEAFETYEDMCAHWEKDENFQRLRDGSYGKLNYAYTFKVLLEYREAFDAFLAEQARVMFDRIAPDHAAELQAKVVELLRFGRALRIKMTDDLALIDADRDRFAFDILAWRRANYDGPLERARGEGVVYDFFLPAERKHKVSTLLRQYRSHNVNMTLRKMSEYIKPHEFFYEVAEGDPGAAVVGPDDDGISLVPQAGTHDGFTYARPKSD